MRSVVPFTIAAWLAIGACSSTSVSTTPAREVTVFAASSLGDAFRMASDEIRKTRPDARFNFNFTSSSTLATQIANGAPADVFASADEMNMQKIVDAKLTDGEPTFFASNRLAIAVAAGNPKNVRSLADLTRADLVVILAAPTVPAGRYARESLVKAGLTVAPASQELDARFVLNKVALGEADAGIVYVTDVRSAPSRVSGIAIPEQHQVIARYPIAVVSGAKNRALAREFVGYLMSGEGQQLLAGLGFSSP